MLYGCGMNAKTVTPSISSRISRARFNPIRNLRPETLSSALDAFEDGRLGGAARIFEAILKRDDLISGLALKRKKSIARLEPHITLLEDSPKAREHKALLQKLYDGMEAENRADLNEHGGLRLLISQMMDAVAFKYAAHKIDFFEKDGRIGLKTVQYPLWLFENTSGELRLLEREGQLAAGKPLEKNAWMVCCGDGLMTASSIAYIFKQLPLRDWLIYCERNGMPGVVAKTDAFPGTAQWDAACEAVGDFGAEFHAVISAGTNIESIDVSSRSALPYQALIERIDRMLCALWRGSDLSTLSASESVGASMQWYESSIIEEQDAANISETLHRCVDIQAIKIAFGENERPLAKFALRLPDYEMHKSEIDIIARLCALGLKPDKIELAKRFAFPLEEKGAGNGGE